MSTGDDFYFNRLIQGGGSYSNIYYFFLRKETGGYKIALNAYSDTGAKVVNDDASLSDAPHYVEIYITQATNSTSNDGTVQWWLDGVDQGTVASIDNYNRMSDQNWIAFLGAASLDAGTSGTIFFDDFVVNNDGGAIGPAGWANISKIDGVAVASISKVNGVAVASISKVNGITA